MKLALSKKSYILLGILFVLTLFLYNFVLQKSKKHSYIEWTVAEDMILSCKVKSLTSSETSKVLVLRAKSGETYMVQQPSKDSVWDLIESLSTDCTPSFSE